MDVLWKEYTARRASRTDAARNRTSIPSLFLVPKGGLVMTVSTILDGRGIPSSISRCCGVLTFDCCSVNVVVSDADVCND